MKLAGYTLLGALLCTNFASAHGFYAGGSFGFSTLNCTGCDLDSGGGGKLFVGYHFNRYLGVEGGYAYLTSNYAGYDYTAKQMATYVAAVGSLPLNRKVGIHVKLGAARSKARANAGLVGGQEGSWDGHAQTTPYWGTGLDFYIEPETTISFGYERFSEETDNNLFQANLTSLSFSVNF